MSRKRAINAKCKDCIYDPCGSGKWRQQVEACPSQDCALWPFRPKSDVSRSIPAPGRGDMARAGVTGNSAQAGQLGEGGADG